MKLNAFWTKLKQIVKGKPVAPIDHTTTPDTLLSRVRLLTKQTRLLIERDESKLYTRYWVFNSSLPDALAIIGTLEAVTKRIEERRTFSGINLTAPHGPMTIDEFYRGCRGEIERAFFWAALESELERLEVALAESVLDPKSEHTHYLRLLEGFLVQLDKLIRELARGLKA